jgi:hypothetical protein
VALTTTFGVNQLESFEVWTDEVFEDRTTGQGQQFAMRRV